ncbi:hypothetical protein ACFLX2_01005 [Candidatus Dependentiae bacterium]
MAMGINATLFVQAFNFFVAYAILRTLLFKPAFKALQQEDKEKDHLKNLIKERETTLEETSEQKDLAWQKFQGDFAQAAPPVRQARISNPSVEPALPPEVLTEEQVESLAQDIQRAVVKRVKT